MAGENAQNPTDKAALPPDQDNAGRLPGIIPPAPPEEKRKPGRPLGSKTRRLNLSKPPASENSVPGAGNNNQSPANIPEPLWTGENCRPFSELPFMLAQFATKYEGWALTPKEADALSKPLAQVLNMLIPQGGKYAAVSALCSTAFVIYQMKNQGYREYLKTHPKTPTQENK